MSVVSYGFVKCLIPGLYTYICIKSICDIFNKKSLENMNCVVVSVKKKHVLHVM